MWCGKCPPLAHPELFFCSPAWSPLCIWCCKCPPPAHPEPTRPCPGNIAEGKTCMVGGTLTTYQQLEHVWSKPASEISTPRPVLNTFHDISTGAASASAAMDPEEKHAYSQGSTTRTEGFLSRQSGTLAQTLCTTRKSQRQSRFRCFWD